MSESKPLTMKARVAKLEEELIATKVQLETLDIFVMYMLVSAMERGSLSPEFVLKQVKYTYRNLDGKYRGFAKSLNDDSFIKAFEAEQASDNAVPTLGLNARRIYEALKPFYEWEKHDQINLDDDD